jgi:hypothetical protein
MGDISGCQSFVGCRSDELTGVFAGKARVVNKNKKTSGRSLLARLKFR